MKTACYLLFTALSLHLFTIDCYAQIIRFRPGRVRLESQFNHYTTSANFDSTGGSYTDLPQGRRYQLSQLSTDVIYEKSAKMSLGFGVVAGFAESSDGTTNRSSSALTRALFRGRYLAYKKYFQLIPELSLSAAFREVHSDTDEVIMDDGAHKVEMGTWFQKRFFGLSNYLFVSYLYRNNGLSSLLTYKTGSSKRFSNYYIGGEVSGFSSISDDDYTDSALFRTNITDRVNGSSLKFYSINPNNLAGSLWAGVKMSKNYMAKFGYTKDLNGENYGAGQTFWFRFEVRSLYHTNVSHSKINRRRKKMEETFVPDIEAEQDTEDEIFLGEEVEIQLEKDKSKSNDDDSLE